MRKVGFLFLCVMSFMGSIMAQKSNVGDAKWSFGGGLLAADLFSPKPGIDYGFKNPLQFGPRVSVWKNFNSSVSLGLDLSSLISKKENDASLPATNQYIVNPALGVIYKLNNGYIMKETTPVAPYLFAQVMGSYIGKAPYNTEKSWGVGLPLGAGINWRLTDDLAFQTSAGYTFGLTEDFEDHIFYTAGVMVDLERQDKKVAEVVQEVIQPIDSDGDGVLDLDDACPNVPGVAAFNGCPDSDADGIQDSEDECPLVAGLASFNGCPDSDGDGISDAKDACPSVKGVAKFGGCPDPDSDGDGIVDSKDKCPTVSGSFEGQGCPFSDRDKDGTEDAKDKCPDLAGPASNKGCPEMKEEEKKKLEFAARNIQFETGKSVLKPASYKVLDEIASILKAYPYYNTTIDGHTDSSGDPVKNQALFEARSKAAYDYLVSKGISASRMKSAGYGATKPIADNKTAEGRAQNRRTEFNLYIPN